MAKFVSYQGWSFYKYLIVIIASFQGLYTVQFVIACSTQNIPNFLVNLNKNITTQYTVQRTTMQLSSLLLSKHVAKQPHCLATIVIWCWEREGGIPPRPSVPREGGRLASWPDWLLTQGRTLLRDYQTPPAAETGVDGSKGETPCSLLPVVREEEG